jgi:hypothetical protein
MTLTAKQLLIDLLGRDYFYREELEGDFTLITDKDEVKKVTEMLSSDIEDIVAISRFHTIAGYIKIEGHYFEFLHFNEPGNTASGYIIYDYALQDGVWVEEAKHHFAPDYELECGKEHILKAKLIEEVFKLPCFVE